MSVEDVKKELEKESLEEIERRGQEYVDSIKQLNETGASAVKDEMEEARNLLKEPIPENSPAETVSSQGYDPSKKPVEPNQGTNKPGNSVPSSTSSPSGSHHGNGLPRQEGVGEQAPDVGKDYGSAPSSDNTYDQVGNGYNPYDQKATQPQDGEGAKSGEEQKQNGGKEEQEKKDGDSSKKEGDQGEKKPDGKDGQTQKSQTGDPSGEGKKGEADKQNSGGDFKGKKQEGNGYGALDKKKQQGSGTEMSDPTARARRNMQLNNQQNPSSSSKTKSGAKPKSSDSKSGGSPLKNAINKAGDGIKKAANKMKNRNNPGGNDSNKSSGEKAANKATGAAKNMIINFMLSHPLSIIVVAIIAIILIVLLFEAMDGAKAGGGRGKRSCTYTLNGVTSTGTVELSNLKVEIINCDGTASGYEVLDTVDFEKYILGVALAEAGPSSPDEALKAQMIAVRNFTLTRNSGMCPGNPSNCFYGYNETTGIIRMRACTNDQVYWDYTKDCPKIERDGQPTLYCEGVTGSTDIWKNALSEERQKEVEALANSVMGEVLLDENGNVLKLGYQKDETDQFIADANAGKSYVEILNGVYGSSSYSSAKCSYGGVYDYGDYTLSSENTTILHEPLEDFLEDNGSSLEEFSELIADNVDDAGWGTRAGVVAAAVTLIGELGDNYGVKVPYYWGGGHYDGVVDGPLGYWGSTKCHIYANDQHYNYCGFDCSGFVPWAIKNGGFKKGVDLAGNFQNMPNARRVQLKSEPVLQPGDLLESKGHIILVVGIDEASGQYICAEAMGNAHGVLFSRRSFTESGYWGVDLEDYYNNPSYIREPIR